MLRPAIEKTGKQLHLLAQFCGIPTHQSFFSAYGRCPYALLWSQYLQCHSPKNTPKKIDASRHHAAFPIGGTLKNHRGCGFQVVLLDGRGFTRPSACPSSCLMWQPTLAFAPPIASTSPSFRNIQPEGHRISNEKHWEGSTSTCKGVPILHS